MELSRISKLSACANIHNVHVMCMRARLSEWNGCMPSIFIAMPFFHCFCLDLSLSACSLQLVLAKAMVMLCGFLGSARLKLEQCISFAETSFLAVLVGNALYAVALVSFSALTHNVESVPKF
eukprot:3076876-Amphidinium_carterae.1